MKNKILHLADEKQKFLDNMRHVVKCKRSQGVGVIDYDGKRFWTCEECGTVGRHTIEDTLFDLFN